MYFWGTFMPGKYRREGVQMKIGEQKTCKVCSKPIRWAGHRWEHMSFTQPSHAGEPDSYTTRDMAVDSKDPDPTDQREGGYVEGARLAWVAMLELCLKNLGYENVPYPGRWIKEREEVKHHLAELCVENGIDYDVEAYLPDQIENMRDHFNKPR